MRPACQTLLPTASTRHSSLRERQMKLLSRAMLRQFGLSIRLEQYISGVCCMQRHDFGRILDCREADEPSWPRGLRKKSSSIDFRSESLLQSSVGGQWSCQRRLANKLVNRFARGNRSVGAGASRTTGRLLTSENSSRGAGDRLLSAVQRRTIRRKLSNAATKQSRQYSTHVLLVECKTRSEKATFAAESITEG